MDNHVTGTCISKLMILPWEEIQPVHPKGYQPWIFTGRTDAEAEALVLWPPDAKGRLTGKDPDAGRDWRQEKKGTTEDEMVGWNHWINRHESEQTLGDGEGQGSLACCSPWGRKESDTTERLNNNPERSEGWRRQDLCEEKKIRSREGKDHHSHSSWGSCQSQFWVKRSR